MLINVGRENIHRFSIGLFFTFFVAQSYITWIASERDQVRIYLRDPDQIAISSAGRRMLEEQSKRKMDDFRTGWSNLFDNIEVTNTTVSKNRTGWLDSAIDVSVDKLSLTKKSSSSIKTQNTSTDNSTTDFNIQMHDVRNKTTAIALHKTSRTLEDFTESPKSNTRPAGLTSSTVVKFSLEEVAELIREETYSVKMIRRLEVRLQRKSVPLETVPDRCPLVPPNLEGRLPLKLKVDPEKQTDLRLTLRPGGRWRPKNCRANHKVAIIIPYRNRTEQLQILLQHLHPLLQKQQLHYAIYVVGLTMPTTFNRGLLMNVGFEEARRLEDYQCYIFHDVDLIPEDDRNLYTCPEANRPRHMSAAVSSFNYQLPYSSIFGGVSAMTEEQFMTVNGFSNLFFGWGGEDDDLSYRLRYKGFQVSRYPMDVSRYTMLSHPKAVKNPDRIKLLKRGKKRPCSEGLSSLQYRLVDLELRPLYTWIFVDVDTNIKSGRASDNPPIVH